jgi:hypothetical protein
VAKESKAVAPKVEATEEQKPVVGDVASEAKKAVVHEDEVTAIKDSRARKLPLFSLEKDEAVVFVVAVSEHQAKLAFVDHVWPLTKWSKKDRDYRYLHLLEAKDAAATSE